MFFILNTIMIAMFIISGISFYKGNMVIGIIFLLLGIFEVIVILFKYGKNRMGCNNLDCILLDCGTDLLGDCGHMGDCNHLGNCDSIGDCVHLGDCDCTP